MPGIDPRFEADADWSPTPDDISKWQENSTPAPPEAKETEEVSPKGESEEPTEPQLEEETPQNEEKPKQEERKKSQYSEKVEKRKNAEHYFNEQHKAIRLREKALKEREEALAKREQELEKTPEDWLAFAQQLEQYGDYEKAEQARQMANQARQQQSTRQTQEQQHQAFLQQWNENERDIEAQDPDFKKEGSYVREELIKLFNDPDLGPMYRAHPDGIWAAYHRVRLQQAQELIPRLVAAAQHWHSEVERLQKGNAPLTSAPRANLGSKQFRDMSDEEMEASIRKELENC